MGCTLRWLPLHTCEVHDVCNNTHILRDKTLWEIHAEVGPAYPILLDGVPGRLGYASTPQPRGIAKDDRDDIVFLPN